MDTSVQRLDTFFSNTYILHNFAAFFNAYMYMTRKKSLESNQLQELAKMYFMQGLKQQEIADKVGVSRNTISAWIKAGSWDTMRAATTVSRKELVTKLLRGLDEKIQNNDWSPDEICKVSAAIEKLDKQTNVITIIEVFSAYNKWLVTRMRIDKDLTSELVKIMNKYQDLFIGEKLSTTIEISVD